MEAIAIIAIIVAGVLGLAWMLLHFGYKAWLEGRLDEKLAKAEAEKSLGLEINASPELESELILQVARDRVNHIATR